jgi:hypothetical protein
MCPTRRLRPDGRLLAAKAARSGRAGVEGTRGDDPAHRAVESLAAIGSRAATPSSALVSVVRAAVMLAS